MKNTTKELLNLVSRINELELGIVRLMESNKFLDFEECAQRVSVVDVDNCLDWLREEAYGFDNSNEELLKSLTEMEAEKVKEDLKNTVEYLENDLEDRKYNR